MKDPLVHHFIDLIKKTRESKGLTMEGLADIAGIHRTTVGLIERHERLPGLEIANALSNALEKPLEEFIQEANLIAQGKKSAEEVAFIDKVRIPSQEFIRNQDLLFKLTGLEPRMLLGAINSCYKTLDSIDRQLLAKNSNPLAKLVELANLSSMVGNIIGGELANYSEGMYIRNKPHAYPDLINPNKPNNGLELKMALEKNRPKGHLPKAGTYITFRYILGNKYGIFQKGKEYRGNTVWIWEVKIGYISEQDFSCSNTVGDSGKTAVIKSEVFNKMPVVYFNQKHSPYVNTPPGFN